MRRLCERPGCSDPGEAEYGMVPEDLLFWIAPLSGSEYPGQAVLCRRHADSMSVPRGWTLDDQREPAPRLFRPRPAPPQPPADRQPTRRRAKPDVGEQLQIDGTGEIPRPAVADDPATPWEPSFDHDNDLDGLLEVSSPLLARAFRGTDRRRS